MDTRSCSAARRSSGVLDIQRRISLYFFTSEARFLTSSYHHRHFVFMSGIPLKRALLWGGLLLLAASPAWAGIYRDAVGRDVTLDTPPRRIVSLAPNVTEILFSLGLGERVVGVTTFCTYPAEAKTKPKIGSFMDLSVEKIISLAPDLVIGTVDGNSRSGVGILERASIKTFVVNPRDVAQTINTIEQLGKICGTEKRGRELASKLRRRVDVVGEKVRSAGRLRVFLQINDHPIMTVNRHTFHNDLINLAGGINIFEDGPISYPRIGIEEVLARKPEAILISSMERGGRFEEARKEWLKWDSLPAVKEGRVYLIDSDIIDRPSPRIVEGLEKMARFLHPEIPWK